MIWAIIAGIALLLFVGAKMIKETEQKAANIATYAKNAGWTGTDLIIAVAVAFAESSGDPMAYNPETMSAIPSPPGKGSYGLWQIDLHEHPEYEGLDLFDPQTNANSAYEIYKKAGNSFRPWSTYHSGAYSKHIAQATEEVQTA